MPGSSAAHSTYREVTLVIHSSRRCCREDEGSASTASTSRRRESPRATAQCGLWAGPHATTRRCASIRPRDGSGTDAVSRLRADRLGRGGLRQGLGRRLDPRHALPDRRDDGQAGGTARARQLSRLQARDHASRRQHLDQAGWADRESALIRFSRDIWAPGNAEPESGEDRGDLGALWWYSWESGSLFRQEVAGGPIRTIHVTRTPADADGPCLTSIAVGSGSLWLTAAPSPDGGITCPPG